ncbi:hypothetical protein JG688_00008954, partial [Phytophthora aleatoria]
FHQQVDITVRWVNICSKELVVDLLIDGLPLNSRVWTRQELLEMPRVAVHPSYDGSSDSFVSLSVCKAAETVDRRAGWYNIGSKLPTRGYQFIRDLHQRTKWTSALRTQMIVMRNAAASVACAWLVNACYSLGNVFSGKPSREQSRRELTAANSVWTSITFCTITLLAQVPLLLSLRFLDAPDHRPTSWFCLKKLVFFKYNFDCYLNTLATHGVFTGITLATRKIYYGESFQGRDRLVRAQQTSRKSDKKLQGPIAQEHLTSASIRTSRHKQTSSYWSGSFPDQHLRLWLECLCTY